jgi:SAM-dependent methyltransferase
LAVGELRQMTLAPLSRTIHTMPELRAARQMPWGTDRLFASAPIAALLAHEQLLAAPDISRVFGHGGLFVRPCADSPALLPGAMTQVMMQLYRCAGGMSGDVRCSDDALPIATACLSLVYAQHVLESSPAGTQLMGEVARVLAPEGVAIFVVFNPLSLVRLRWCNSGLRAITPSQVARMLGEHGLEVRTIRPLGYCWRAPASCDVGSDMKRSSRLASSYLVLARKRVHGMTPLRVGGARVAWNNGVGAQ